MALIRCTECGKEISDKAQACINCGCPLSAMRPQGVQQQPAQNPQRVHTTGNAMNFNETFGDLFATQQRRPVAVKPVPKEMPEPSFFGGLFVAILEKVCGLAGYGGISALIMLVADLLTEGWFDQDAASIAVLGVAASFLLGAVLAALEFGRAKRFIRRNGYEDSIRRDTSEYTNVINAFGLCPGKSMARYIGSLNPGAGKMLEDAVKNAKADRRKVWLSRLPFLAILVVVYYMIPNFGWAVLPTFESALVATHVVTLVVMAACAYKGGAEFNLAFLVALLFAPTMFAYYMENEWMHILICAVAAFAGMFIGGILPSKK